MSIHSRIIESPIGDVFVEADEQGIARVLFCDVLDVKPVETSGSSEILDKACEQLKEYFLGERTEFELPLSQGGTDFQSSVWKALQAIPYGETSSYQSLADAISNPKAVRAVGSANGKNSLFIVVPCHRVIGKDGSLTGYAGGVERKRWLLALEQRNHSTG